MLRTLVHCDSLVGNVHRRGAFSYCAGLTSIAIPSSVASVGNGAFADCSKLKTVIHAKTTKIGVNAFPADARVLAQ